MIIDQRFFKITGHTLGGMHVRENKSPGERHIRIENSGEAPNGQQSLRKKQEVLRAVETKRHPQLPAQQQDIALSQDPESWNGPQNEGRLGHKASQLIAKNSAPRQTGTKQIKQS